MNIEDLSLQRQLAIVFKELELELSGLTSGTIFVQIRNNVVGKFGIKQVPLMGRNGSFSGMSSQGLSAAQQLNFRNMAIESLNYKRSWTHGEISFEFALRQDMVVVDATMESNYNMANLMIRYTKASTYQKVNKELS
ncbi:O-methyltransferase [Paenibacillus shirakamiensis]|uniref:O-methyltransferase n=1 Tax=Paenibacillus shirakamiensis TaxID=1265935 RepID=UPI001FDAC1A8|nr:O-methyltransferase [Paenibacillus shirakamiensis]